MTKKSFILLAFTLLISANLVSAETINQQIQSPIYTDDIGRAHFLGKGGYSSVRHIDMGAAQADAINEVSKDMQKASDEIKKTVDAVETDITKVIKEKNEVPVANKAKASFSTEDRQMDPSATFGRGATYLPSSGVNNSKTIYTDDIGRLHFFGKGNLIKDSTK